jgi:hypothetical protein
MSWERLQSVLMQVQNRRVRDFFKDLEESPIATTGRAALRDACLLEDSDTAPMTIVRLALYYLVLEGGQAMHPPIYSIPVDRYHQRVAFRPQVTLFFKEDLADVEEGYAPLTAELSFRLKTSDENITPAEAQVLANKIRAEFATGPGYRWRKGRILLTYQDKEKGYLFQVYAASENEGKEVMRKVMSIQNDTLDEDLVKINQLASTPPTVPPMRFIYGKSRRLPRKRPVGWVRFVWAEMHVWGVQNAIVLVDRSGRRRSALIAV